MLSALGWSTPDELLANVVGVFAVGASLVQVTNPDDAVTERRIQTEKVTKVLTDRRLRWPPWQPRPRDPNWMCSGCATA